jgi:hypothetical protein
LNEWCKDLGYDGVFHVTDIQIQDYIKQNKLSVCINNENEIRYRDVLRGGRTECYVHEYKINTATHCIRGFDITSLYPSMMLLNLPLNDSVIIEGGDSEFVNDLRTCSK